MKLLLGCKLNLCPAAVQFWVNITKILLVALITPHHELHTTAQKEMLFSKAGILSANSTTAEEKGTAVEYLPRRTNQPTPDPFPELFCDEVQKSCTSIYALQDLKRFASILASSGQLHNGKWSTRFMVSPCPCTLLWYLLCGLSLDSDLYHLRSNITKFSCRFQGHISCIMIIMLCGTKCSRSKCSLFVGGGWLTSEGTNKMTHAEKRVRNTSWC